MKREIAIGKVCTLFVLCGLFLLSLTPVLGRPTSVAQARPNIIFILADDLRTGALSCEGHPFVKTPNIDRLAREGKMFRNAFVTIPVCTPSRASYLTGQYPHTNGIIVNTRYHELSHRLITFPRLLQQSGYESAYIGKWHMGQDDTPRPGFNRWISFKGQGERYDPTLNVDGKEEKVKGYATDILTDYAVEFIKRERAKPFSLYLAPNAVHGPFIPAERHKQLFADQPIKRAPSATDQGVGKPAIKGVFTFLQDDEKIRNQLRMLIALDEGVGRLLKALEETEQLDNTLIIFTSDHGYFWGEHGLGEKRLAYEESIRVPLLMRYPKLIKAGTTSEQFALSIDIAPTLLEVAGAPVPKDIQGRSLVPLLKGSSRGWRKSILTEFYEEKGTKLPRIPGWQSVRTEQWKYIRYHEREGFDELYNLKADPFEMKNLITEPSAQAALKMMKAELEKLLASYQNAALVLQGDSVN